MFVRAEREGYRQRERKKERKKERRERGGGVWPTFHSSLCTVGQAMHAERLESLCNTTPDHHPHPPPNAPPHALLLIFQNKRCLPPVLNLSSWWRGWTHICSPLSLPRPLFFLHLTEITCESLHLEKLCDTELTSVPLTQCQIRPDRNTKMERETETEKWKWRERGERSY